MDEPRVSGGRSDSSVEIQPDKRWFGTLLCCLSALVTTVFFGLVTLSFLSTGDQDLARGEDHAIEQLSPSGSMVRD